MITRRLLFVLGVLASVLAIFLDAGGLHPLQTARGAEPLDASSIRLLCWNVHKGADPGFPGELAGLLSEDAGLDLLILQEAQPWFPVGPEWSAAMAGSWRLPGLGPRNGVMTLSRDAPLDHRAMRTRRREILVTTPKASLLSWHELPGCAESLLVANVHALNFEPHQQMMLEGQLETLAEALSEHPGPMIVAGDFNTWSLARRASLEAFASSLELERVRPEAGQGTTSDLGVLGNWLAGVDPVCELDHVLVRDLEVVRSAWCPSLRGSDHVALEVELRWTGGAAPAERNPAAPAEGAPDSSGVTHP